MDDLGADSRGCGLCIVLPALTDLHKSLASIINTHAKKLNA